MKRTNLVLDEQSLKTATRLLGVKTYSAAVNKALLEVIRLAHVRGLAKWHALDLWEGDLAIMREDMPRRSTSTKGKSKKR